MIKTNTFKLLSFLILFLFIHKEVVEWYVDGEKNDDQVTSSKKSTFLILEGVFSNNVAVSLKMRYD